MNSLNALPIEERMLPVRAKDIKPDDIIMHQNKPFLVDTILEYPNGYRDFLLEPYQSDEDNFEECCVRDNLVLCAIAA